MNWITLANEAQEFERQFSHSQKNLQRFNKFTLYDHNYTSQFSQEDLKFTCVFNCKRLNRNFSTICQIEGDLKYGQISISCSLLDQMLVVGGKWNYERTELIRFAISYNQRSNNNIIVKVNPINGEVCVALDFLVSPAILRDPQNLKQIVTEYAESIGEESEKIFNTIIEIIYCKEADQPYLKSPRANAAFPPHIKVQKLLDKVKPLIATSSHYEIRKDISSAHKNRSFFKKLYLTTQAKVMNNPTIYQYARAYELKFHQKYEESTQQIITRQRTPHFIKRYQEIQEKYQTQFAKHLNKDDLKERSVEYHVIAGEVSKGIEAEGQEQQFVNFNDILLLTDTGKLQVHIEPERQQLLRHQLAILQKVIVQQHPNIVQYYQRKDKPIYDRRITEGMTIPLEEYLSKNKEVMWLVTKLQLMSQICHVMQYLHTLKLVYPLSIENMVVASNFKVKIRNLSRAEKIDPGATSVQGIFKNSEGMKISQERKFPYINCSIRNIEAQKLDVYSLGMVLYRILMEKFPFYSDIPRMNNSDVSNEEWQNLWVVETESFLQYGGKVAKLLANLLLKCLIPADQGMKEHMKERPYVEWITVIIFEINHSLKGLF